MWTERQSGTGSLDPDEVSETEVYGGSGTETVPRPPPASSDALLPPTEQLRRICQDPVQGDAVLRHDPFYRHVSIHLTRLTLKTRLSAHMVTTISLLAGLLAGISLAGLTIPRLALAVVLVQLYLMLDYVDGEVARYRGQASIAGRFYEQAGCNAIDPLLFLGLSIGVYRCLDAPIMLVLGVSGALAHLYFRMCPVLINATLTNVYMGVMDRSTGEATPEPAEVNPPPSPWARRLEAVYFIYRRFRFPYFHPNYLMILTLGPILDIALVASGRLPLLSIFIVAFYGITAPPYVVWQILNIIHLRIPEQRYRELFVHGRKFHEHV